MFKDTSMLRRLAPKPEPMALVYFISTRDRPHPIKIGRSTNCLASLRLSQLQVGNPYQLEFFAALPAGAEVEIELHDRFRKSAIRGEWFNRSPELTRFIDGVQRDHPAWRTYVRAPKPGALAELQDDEAGGLLTKPPFMEKMRDERAG